MQKTSYEDMTLRIPVNKNPDFTTGEAIQFNRHYHLYVNNMRQVSVINEDSWWADFCEQDAWYFLSLIELLLFEFISLIHNVVMNAYYVAYIKLSS